MNPNDAKMMPIVEELRKKGDGYAEIAKVLKTEHLVRLKGRPYSATAISNLYTGYCRRKLADRRERRKAYNPDKEKQAAINEIYRARAIDALLKTTIKDRAEIAKLIETGLAE